MIYAIGDLHLDHSKEKPMDVFGENWIDHEQKIIDNWKKKITDEDLVLIPGDISWALRLDQAKFDLELIDKLPGRKVFIKGNHDYWWQSLNKINKLGFESLYFLQNTSYKYEDVAIAGTRGWISKDSDDFTASDEKVYRRELMRLEMSLENMDKNAEKKIVIMHYPPFDYDSSPNEFVDLMKEHGVDICLYGHLHAEGHRHIVEGKIEGIDFQCVSSDYIEFNPKLIV